jgi:mannose-1-phosphate guanylyltransferase
MKKAILLAAGFGTRLGTLVAYTPKCLIDINGQPLLDIWLGNLIKSGVQEILINTHYLSEVVAAHIERSKYKHSVSLRYESKLCGTAGTIFANIDFLDDEPILVAHADNLSIFSVAEFESAHQSRPKCCNMTMMTFLSPNPMDCGVVGLNADGVVIEFTEKPAEPRSNLANGAVYILEASFIRSLYVKGNFPKDFSTELIPSNLGKIFTFLNDRYHRDIGNPESLRLGRIEYALVKSKGVL